MTFRQEDSTTRIPVAVIVDDGSVAEWQRRALAAAGDELEVRLVLDCRNTARGRRPLRHCAYYALNLYALRGPLTRRVPFDPGCETVAFEAHEDGGAWQRLPERCGELLRERGIALVVKFGMSLLRIDEALEGIDVLSYHHGDPERYRGRPAGFWELQENADRVGIIVQKLSNTLDGGEVLARAHSRINHRSYRATANRFYENSEHLLGKAVRNRRAGRAVPIASLGRNYRLPGNADVALLVARLAARTLRWLLYGVLYEKGWNVVRFDDVAEVPTDGRLSVADGKRPAIGEGYSFYADPFFAADGASVRVEALNGRSGLGEIVELDGEGLRAGPPLLAGPHYSYPVSLADGDTEYLVPEVADHSAPLLFRLPLTADSAVPMRGLEHLRAVDSTPFRHEERFYLFAGVEGSWFDCLHLFVAEAIDGPYAPHPDNPVVIDPSCARMGGRIVEHRGELLRFGQDCSRSYGDGLVVSRVTELSPTRYVEEPIGRIAFDDAHGPHTLDVSGSSMLMDFYVERFSPLAGYRRLRAKLSAA